MSTATSITQSSFKNPIVVMCITLLACFFVLATYMHGSLQGNFNHFFMPAEKFGIPSELKAHGLTVMYKGPIETGWDGQFYYYISNDILAQKDTIQHIDSNAYRYQRIGLPLLAKIASVITGRAWVSPLTYYLTNLLLIIFTAGCAAAFLERNKINPYFILFWSVGCGTQLTLLHGLPDGAADALLILAIIFLLNKRNLFYAITITFAALSREIYILLPCFIAFSILIHYIRNSINFFSCFKIQNILFLSKNSWMHLIPITIFISWQIFLRVKFGVSPSSQASSILGWPFASAFHHLTTGLHGAHPIVGNGIESYLEGIGIILFLLLLSMSMISLVSLLIYSNPFKKCNNKNTILSGISLTFITVIIMYVCFGSTVMMRYSGYFKATNIFLFIIPLLACLRQQSVKHSTTLFLIVVTLFFDYLLWESISESPYRATPPIKYITKEPACLTDYRSKIIPVSIEEVSAHGIINKLLVPRNLIINVKIINQSTQSFSPYQGKGSVNVSYQWLRVNDLHVARDGTRTQLTRTLYPKENMILPLYINLPIERGEYYLKLSLVQEGCNWFYLINPQSTFTIPYTIR